MGRWGPRENLEGALAEATTQANEARVVMII